MLKETIESLDRPAWTQEDLYAFNHKHTIIRGKYVVIENYYAITKGKKEK